MFVFFLAVYIKEEHQCGEFNARIEGDLDPSFNNQEDITEVTEESNIKIEIKFNEINGLVKDSVEGDPLHNDLVSKC